MNAGATPAGYVPRRVKTLRARITAPAPLASAYPAMARTVKLEHPHTVPADGAVGVEVEGHQAFWTCDNKLFILVLTTVPPHTDVNECLSNPCSQECANVYGSFQCYCKQGYYLREDGLTCEVRPFLYTFRVVASEWKYEGGVSDKVANLDECSQSAGHLCAFKCVNVPGSYQCSCPEHGYIMSPNGRSCRDIDECGLGAHNCTVEETCYNIQGGFRCLSFSCPPNYRRTSDTRCERISCANFVECQNTPVRITYYQLSFQTNIIIPAQIFRIGPSPAYSGDNIIISFARGNEEGYFSTRKLNAYTGAIYLHRQVQHPRDFLIDVEMKLWRQGTFTTFLARIYVFITPNILIHTCLGLSTYRDFPSPCPYRKGCEVFLDNAAYKAKHGPVPLDLMVMVGSRSVPRAFRASSTARLGLPSLKAYRRQASKLFSVLEARRWNELPLVVRTRSPQAQTEDPSLCKALQYHHWPLFVQRLTPCQSHLQPCELENCCLGIDNQRHQAFWTCDHNPFILVLTTVPPHTDSLGVSTKTKAGLVTEDDPLPF
ncbi:hypothetical protein NFI96_005275 [Prochilodus magdalenae]|nr:hypothetical protein NFI96_005275 [Prochilodus magdalenae]